MSDKSDFLTMAYLASAMRKFLLNDEAYMDIGSSRHSACLDGWVWNLSDEETEAMQSVRKEIRPDD